MALIIEHPLTNCHEATPPSFAWVTDGLASVGRTIQAWRARARERRAFADFEERDLHDLGLSRWHIEQELSKRFWQP
jgi:uncharacterized protein YjiS (DUF1127 family)